MAVAAYKNALQVKTGINLPNLWAQTMRNLTLSMSSRRLGQCSPEATPVLSWGWR